MQTWPRAILHLDMDAFFVNVHILSHPEDGSIPLVVGGQPQNRGVVASASYEARKMGIHSAMPTKTAVHLCPHLKIVSTDWQQIHRRSRQVMALLGDYGPVEQMSVDEAYIGLSECDNPEKVAVEIQTAVKTKTSLPCSVGLATSKLVAKVASDHDKPEGCTIVPPGDEATFLAPLPTRAIWGIGPKTAAKLAGLDITTCGQLAAADLLTLRRVAGNQAESLQQRAAGIDDRPVQPDHGLPKSISQEWTFNEDVGDADILGAQLQKMCGRVAQSLQKRQLIAYTVTVKFRWADFTTYTRQKSVAVGFDDAETLFAMAYAVWAEHWPPDKKLRLLGVGVSKLEKPQLRQLGFDFN
ncbi:MAG: DNA polymerase IV [Chloroflexi bacterium]|nr:DNA polymerase IV [Chloroflexota bacterium]